MKFNLFIGCVFLLSLSSCDSKKKMVDADQPTISTIEEISSITNKTPYNPKPGMERLRKENIEKTDDGEIKLKQPIHFLVFGDSKGSPYLQDVLKRADTLSPQFCITTADLVNKGAGEIGLEDYRKLDKDAGWFLRKYPTWPTLGNHEVSGSSDKTGKENYEIGEKNFSDFFGLQDPVYSFTYGNAKFIALDWDKVSNSPEKFAWLENELKDAQGKHIFIFKHRPYYTVGSKGYNDVEGKTTEVTKLFTKYKVTAVFSGHDHIYHRTKRDGVNYIISAGAGASIYNLKREKDAIDGDVYYGRFQKENPQFKYISDEIGEVTFNEAMYYVVSVKVDGTSILIEMIDTNGKTWDQFSFTSEI
jgi:3',5'-cyclic AMP phosphodiesterase CpdA